MAVTGGPNIVKDNLQIYIESRNTKITVDSNVKNLIPAGTLLTFNNIGYSQRMLRLNQSDSYINIPIDLTHTGITINYIIRYPDTNMVGSSYYDIIYLVPKAGDSGSNIFFTWEFSLRQNNPKVIVGNITNQPLSLDATSYHTHVRMPDGTYKNYLNGKLYNSNLTFPVFTPASIATNFENLRIGQYLPISGLNQGAIPTLLLNNIMLYNKALTDIEVLQNFNSFRTRYNYKY